MKPFIPASLFCLLASQTAALPWADAIADAKARSERLTQAWIDLGGPNPGNHSMNAIASEHRCAIIGRMGGRADLIGDLETLEIAEPRNDMTEDELLELAEGIKSLDIWIVTAEAMTDMDAAARLVIWDATCTGNHGIPANATLATN